MEPVLTGKWIRASKIDRIFVKEGERGKEIYIAPLPPCGTLGGPLK
jgi:hypothetical protein